MALLLGMGMPTRALVPLPEGGGLVMSLDGTWRFKLEQAPKPPRFLSAEGRPIPIQYPTNIEPFYLPDYHEDSAWHNLEVPGNWEMAGYSPATYDQPDNASGLYRLMFAVPGQWKGRRVKVNFDGVQNGCEVWCNGLPVPVSLWSWGRTNYHESGWTAWQADLTSAIKFGESNLLALRVTKNTRSVDCDTGDFFFLGGVDRPVTLFSVPQSYISDVTVRTKLLGADAAEVTVLAQVAQPEKGEKLSMRLEGQAAVEGEPDSNGQVVLQKTVQHPRLWSAEFPNLYTLALSLQNADGRTTEGVSRRIGIREISIEKGVFMVNHVPVKLVGICRHDVYPTLGTAITPEVWKKDLSLMKAANFNAVRTSHYPYGSGFYKLCDEMGFYVLDEEPFCWVNCDDATLRPAFEQRARETVERDKNHPCVVIWGIGNENRPGRENALAAHITRELDPTRPRLISSLRADQTSEEVEFDDAHYVSPERIRRDEQDPRRAKWPMIYSENPNVWDVRNGPDYGSLDLWWPVIERTWRELWHDPHVTGTFLWEWQDRAIADKCPTKYYDYYPDTGINLVKVKGVVDGFRNPRPEYYHIKMAQSPIGVGLKPYVVGGGVVLQVTNRYSFTDLKVLTVRWLLIQASRTLAGGETHLSLPPGSQGHIRLRLPPKALAAADSLRLDFDHPGGWNVVTYELTLKPRANPAPEVASLGEILFPKFNLVTGKRVRDGKGWWRLDRRTGELANIKVQLEGGTLTPLNAAQLSGTPLAKVAVVEADVLLQPGAQPCGHLRAALTEHKMSYRFVWSGPKTDLYELGWIFAGPQGADRFSWDRKAVWSYYPPGHIGRPTGTALPDSARASLTRVDRPDAFDFNSTKFDCNWATLTDAAGRGLCFVFSPEQRQDVRGELERNGNCGLIVDRCYSPPRDISSGFVGDLYTVLTKDKEVLGHFEIRGAL